MFLLEAEFHDASTLAEASELMTRFGPEARLLAGGTDLLYDVTRGRFQSGHIISINRMSSLRGITPGEDGLRIGALTTINQLIASAVIRERFPAILDAAPKMGGAQIRNMATVGGNIANANRSADLPPVLLAMNASVSLWSGAGQRVVPLKAFFIGPKQTVRRADEVLTEVFIPYPPARSGAAFARFTLREGHAIAVAGVAASLVFGGDGLVWEARIGLSGVSPTARLAEDAATLLTGHALDDISIGKAAAAAVQASQPLISDLRGQADFRQALVVSLTRRALLTARERAQAEKR